MKHHMIKIVKSRNNNEFRVILKGSPDATYYTDSLDDAEQTMAVMINEYENTLSPYREQVVKHLQSEVDDLKRMARREGLSLADFI